MGSVGREIERKFLVVSDAWRTAVAGVLLRQGYLCLDPDRTVRVRVAGGEGFLTIKGRGAGCTRPEFEYAIPLADAEELLGLCQLPPVEKTRFEVIHAGRVWQVDEFHGANRGLVVAEVELESADDEVERPAWAGEEVTSDRRYLNSSLAVRPFVRWDGAR
jgi:CYTH domain-containing protein